MRYLFDTNILIHFIRESPLFELVIERYAPFSSENFACISVVSIGELKSFAKQRRWGTAKLARLENLLNEFVLLDINRSSTIERYAEIDAFSQNLLPDRPLGKTPRNMGKNDIWIAATASVADAVLLTTDHDFDHLDKVFLQLERL
jgi:predicted nucleic acid-binding protein